MSRAGAKLTKGLTLPLIGLAAVATDQAAKYQKSLNTIQVATDRTNREMAAGSKGLLTIAKSTGTMLGDLTDSFYVASKSGLSVAKSLEVTRAAAQGAKAEGADLGTVTDALTSIMASYGKSIKSPVAGMNEIIRGAGLAKTTTQDFSASLSNVVPIASALGISFDQVAGAIATMTQHGETAQRATDNLSNLITNLAGQNNVAASALGQLGINTIDLSRNLGKRGLTGSLNLVLDAIAKHSKAGLVVTDAFKQSATATASLRQELDAMPPALQKQAQAFDSGKTSYKDFYTFVKSLGGQQFQLGKGFIATEATAKGFNSQLKSGNSTTSTLARTLQKALGGVTGMRTALMLSGNSAKTFASDTKAVGKAALNAGSDVLGWNKTQDTLAVKMDKAKASLQVLAVEIGTKLIPVVGKIVDGISSAVHWFENLSGTQKKVLVWSVGILAAMGPILLIGGKLALLGRGIMLASTTITGAFTRIATGASVTNLRLASAMRGIGSAIGGAAIGTAVGTLTANASTSTRAIGVLGAAAAGAALGSGFGGLGAVIGGVAGGVSALASQFIAAGDNAKAAIAPTDDYTNAILRDKDALGAETRALVVRDIGKAGGFQAGLKLGVGPKVLTDALLGNASAQQKVNRAMQVGHNIMKTQVGPDHRELTKAEIAQINASGKLGGIYGNLTKTIAVNKKEADYETKAMALGSRTARAQTKALAALKDEQAKLGKGLTGVNALIALNGASISKNTDAGKKNRAGLVGMIQEADHYAKKQLDAGVAIGKVNLDLDKNIVKFQNQAHAAGFSMTALGRLVTKYKATPKQIVTNLVANIDKATANAKQLQTVIDAVRQGKVPGITADTKRGKAVIAAIQTRIDALHQGTPPAIHVNPKPARDEMTSFGAWFDGYIASLSAKTITPSVNIPLLGSHPDGQSPAKHPKGPQHDAAGGPIRDGYFTVGEEGGARGWELGHKSGSSLRFWSNRDSRKKTGWNRVPGFATGTKPPKNTGTATSSAVGRIGSPIASPIDLSTVGIARVWMQIRAARASLASDVADGLGAKAAARFRSQIHHMVHLANQEFAKLQVKIRTSDMHALTKALKGSASDTRAAFGQLFADLRHANAPGGVLSALTKAETGLIANQKAIVAGNARLDKMTAYRSSVRGTLAGAFDPTTFGSVQDLRAGLSGATGTNNSYASELSKLRGESTKGSALRKFINRLAASGQTTTLATLAGASRGQLANVAKDVRAYDRSLGAGANAATQAKFNESVQQQHGDVDRLVKSQHEINASIGELARIVAHIASTGPTKAQDKRLEHVLNQLGRHVEAGQRSG